MFLLATMFLVYNKVKSDNIDALSMSNSILRSYEAYNEGVAFWRKNEYRTAQLRYETAIRLNNAFPEAHQNLALVYELNGKMEDALYHHKQSISFATTLEFKA